VLAYLFWHRAAAAVETGAYERELERFHRSLAHRPPSGFCGSASFRIGELPWPGEVGEPTADGEPAYEDWYVVEDWAALGVLEEAAVSRGHVSVHETVAKHTALGPGAVYRLLEGSSHPQRASLATWISTTRLPGRERPSLESLLADGIDPDSGGLWQRCLMLGPAPEYCLLANESPAGAAASRLPAGWSALGVGREPLWDD
jgi:hypothetical protein